MKKVIVTTSWDDGHKLDVRLAALLHKYGIKGTFYIAPEDEELHKNDLLTPDQIKAISQTMEIGAHTMQHKRLPSLSNTEALSEMQMSKKYLEQVTNTEVTSFCYPCGDYRPKHVKMAEEAGFNYARTINRHSFKTNSLLEASTTIHTYNHFTDIWEILVFSKFNLRKFFRYFDHWDKLAIAMFDETIKNGGVFHMWGHSWELEQNNDWGRLENVLKHISNKPNVQYVTNKELATIEINTSKKVLVVAPYFPPHVGGSEFYAYNIAKGLQEKYNWAVCIVASEEKGFNAPLVKGKFENLPIYHLPYWFKASNTPINFLWYWKLKKIIKIEKPDIIHLHSPVTFMADLAANAAKRKQKIILTYHSGTLVKYRLPIDVIIWAYEVFFLPKLFRRANAIVPISSMYAKVKLQEYKNKIDLIPPGVDIKRFTQTPYTFGNQTVTFVGRIDPNSGIKGINPLLHGMALVVKKYPQAKLNLVGGGDSIDFYKDLSKKLGIENSVNFLGPKMGEDLVVAYANAGVVILPSTSDSESFGMVLIEAMASGRPVIGSNIGGIPQIIDHEINGLLSNPNDPESIAESIGRIFDNEVFTMSLIEKGIEKARTFSWDIQVEKYNTLLTETLFKKPQVAQIVGYYPPHLGGMEVVAEEISLELATRNYPVTVFTSNIPKVKNINDNAKNYQVKRLSGFEIFHTPVLWSFPFKLMALPKGSILHVHISQIGLPEIALLIAKLKGHLFIAHFHLDVNPSGKAGFLLPLYKKYLLGEVLRTADNVIVFSEEQSDLVTKLYGVKKSAIKIIANGVSKEFFTNQEKENIHNPFKLLYLGRLSVQKRVDRLIDAMALIKNPAHLTIVGDGEDRLKLEAQVKKLGLTNITFEGKKFGAELREYYKNSDAFIISSDREGMPLVVLEAMAAGLPIIATNVIGLRELVENTGVLVNEPFVENLAKEIDNLSQNNEQNKILSQKSITKAKEYTWSRLVDELEVLYNKI